MGNDNWQHQCLFNFKAVCVLLVKLKRLPGEEYGGLCLSGLRLQGIIHILQVLGPCQLRQARMHHLREKRSDMQSVSHTLAPHLSGRLAIGDGHKESDYQGEQVEEEAGVFADQVVGLAAQVHKQLEAAGGPLSAVDHIRHVRGQHERSTVPEHRKAKVRLED